MSALVLDNSTVELADTALLLAHAGPRVAPRCTWLPSFARPHAPASASVTEVSLRNVLSAVLSDDSTVSIVYLAHESPKHRYSLVRFEGRLVDQPVPDTQEQLSLRARAQAWCTAVMAAAYDGRSPPRKLKVLVNPHGGRGRARSMFDIHVKPILVAAGCTLDETLTTRPHHATEIARELSLDYDALVIVSGDGLIHEVFNGFHQHPQSDKAFAIPIAPIPAGSGNGLSLNLLGIQDGLDPRAGALNILKGRPLRIDLFAFTQGNQTRLSFMSQTVGLMADLDIETEHLRWMGDGRFVLGFLRSIVTRPTRRIEFNIQVVEQDKTCMADASSALRASASFGNGTQGDAAKPSGDTWIKYDQPCLWMFAGQGPYVSRSLMQFPVSHPDDGCIDISIQEIIPRKLLLSAMDGAERGRCYWFTSNRYFKATAYTAKPLDDSNGALVIDGELFPLQEFRVDVLPRHATVLSPYPHYAPEFTVIDEKGTSKDPSYI